MYINIYEQSGRSQRCKEMIAEAEMPPGIRGVELLPIPTRAESELYKDGKLDSLLSGDYSGVVFAGYDMPLDFSERLLRGGGILCDSSLDETFLRENAHLTSVGAAGHILHALSFEKPPTVGIIGYGRIGACLVRMLLPFGVGVRVFTGRENVRIELGEMGIETSGYGEDANFDSLDMLVNTAPATTVTLPDGVPVFELASGDNYRSERLTRLPAIPAKLYPRAAGAVWARSILRRLGVGEV